MVEIVEKQGLAVYSTASEIAAVYVRESQILLELREEVQNSIARLNEAFCLAPGKYSGGFWAEVNICERDETEEITRELKRTAWRVLIEKLELRRVTSAKRQREFDQALTTGKHSPRPVDDPICTMFPEISPETICDVLSGYVLSANEFLDESLEEIYQWLKPYQWDKLKTNEHNRWKLSRKVILNYALSERYGGKTSYFRPEHSSHPRLMALDNIMHLLDGKGCFLSHYGPLCDGIQKLNTSGQVGETDYFRFKCYDNRKLHLEFKRPDLVDEFNFRNANRTQLPGNNEGRFWKPNAGPDPRNSHVKGATFDFFPTPDPLAQRLVKLAGVKPGMSVLEPSAGTGCIAAAAAAAGGNVVCVEIQSKFIPGLKAAGYIVVPGDFLTLDWPENAALQYDAVVMNPPFSKCQDVRHISHAWGFLKPGGTLVSVASSGTKFRSDKLTQEFRSWVNELRGEIIDLPDGSFSESGTEVSTIIIKLRKTAEPIANIQWRLPPPTLTETD